MSRRHDRIELEQGAASDPNGWEARWLKRFGMEGALDVLAAQRATAALSEVDYRRRPWSTNPELKEHAYEVREVLRDFSAELWDMLLDDS